MTITTINSAVSDFSERLRREGGTASAIILDALRAAIITGELAPGQAISELEISKRFAISRQPVREAFILLGQERLIEVRPNRGTFIRKISVREVIDACFVREVIELAIVREVTRTRSATLIRKLRKNIASQKKVKTGDSRTFLDLDEEMHYLLAQNAKRDFAWEVTQKVKAQLNRVRFLTYDHATPIATLVAEHEAIVDAIEAGDADQAEKEMLHHMSEIYRSLPIMAEKYPDIFIE
ncbi:GntR family transcriptional regulator [uncultured Propionivibrio sp.]|uniref:GntR family transcriptional regulator n=1 Tax=uncultured Propionivibrio sp. TaxID=426737 RepID=UPI0029C02D62|nr:GntR family transcriptional regulator [uncultured Propionivibrio sp.]